MGIVTFPDQEPRTLFRSCQLNATETEVAVAEAGTVTPWELPVAEAPVFVCEFHLAELAVSTVPVDTPPSIAEYVCLYPYMNQLGQLTEFVHTTRSWTPDAVLDPISTFAVYEIVV